MEKRIFDDIIMRSIAWVHVRMSVMETKLLIIFELAVGALVCP
jgi:hypothetical protein